MENLKKILSFQKLKKFVFSAQQKSGKSVIFHKKRGGCLLKIHRLSLMKLAGFAQRTCYTTTNIRAVLTLCLKLCIFA
jgi:hypothetical protein